jgi:hypothetical protein
MQRASDAATRENPSARAARSAVDLVAALLLLLSGNVHQTANDGGRRLVPVSLLCPAGGKPRACLEL